MWKTRFANGVLINQYGSHDVFIPENCLVDFERAHCKRSSAREFPALSTQQCSSKKIIEYVNAELYHALPCCSDVREYSLYVIVHVCICVCNELRM